MNNDTIDNTLATDDAVPNSGMSLWLSNILERTFMGSGLRPKQKVASKDAIASLQEVSAGDVPDEACPICFEPYQAIQNKKLKVGSDILDDLLCKELNDQINDLIDYGVDLEPASSTLKFRDPSIFMPVEATGLVPIRFPQVNLYNGETVTEDQMIPGNSKKLPVTDANMDHVAVRMPKCHHIFGKPCIIEWLNGNVSCPLCRKEMESVQPGNSDNIRDICTFTFAPSAEDAVTHLADRLTDVFNPYRRPWNPAVTPLTDSLMNQAWATPSYPHHLTPTHVESLDPMITMARSFPLPVVGQRAETPMPFRTIFPVRPREDERRNWTERMQSVEGGENDDDSKEWYRGKKRNNWKEIEVIE